jgi:hypothetical protein
VEKPQQVSEIEPEAAIETTGIQPTVQERVMPLHHHEPFTFQAMHVVWFQRIRSWFLLQRNRFKIKARQPASSPPPRIVVVNVENAVVLPVELVLKINR